MSQIQKKFIKADAVDETKILLLNNGAMRARNAADSADVELMKLDGADKLQLYPDNPKFALGTLWIAVEGFREGVNKLAISVKIKEFKNIRRSEEHTSELQSH